MLGETRSLEDVGYAGFVKRMCRFLPGSFAGKEGRGKEVWLGFINNRVVWIGPIDWAFV